jgi:hypothetical protein
METVLLTPTITFGSMQDALAFVEKTNTAVDIVKKQKIAKTDVIIISIAVIGLSMLGYSLYVHLKEEKSFNNIKKIKACQL